MTRSFFSFLLVIVSSWSIAVYSAIDSNLEIISEQTQVHIGIISPGAGVSILGHAFVNMSEAGMTPLFGISISYTGVILNGSTRIRVSSNSFPSN